MGYNDRVRKGKEKRKKSSGLFVTTPYCGPTTQFTFSLPYSVKFTFLAHSETARD